MKRHATTLRRAALIAAILLARPRHSRSAGEEAAERTYDNRLTRLADPPPLLADHPEFVDPIREETRYEAAPLVDDAKADLDVRAWRFSYNARGIIEMPNHLRAAETALIVVHPWGIDDGQGWRTPEPAGVCDFCTPEKNRLSHRHIQQVLNPFIKSLRGKVGFVMYSQPYGRDGVREKIYRTFTGKPSDEERRKGLADLKTKLNAFPYKGEPIPGELKIRADRPVIDYFKSFPGLDATAKYNGAGFWDLPNPVVKSIDVDPDDVLIFDGEGYDPLKKFLQDNGIRHVILAGYATDMCFQKTTAGFDNLSKDFDVFLVGDATLATFPGNNTPAHATNAAISFASLDHLITQTSWIQYRGGK